MEPEEETRGCEYCGEPMVVERVPYGERRAERLCGLCDEDLRRYEDRRRREDAIEAAADQALSEWKDEGRRR